MGPKGIGKHSSFQNPMAQVDLKCRKSKHITQLGTTINVRNMFHFGSISVIGSIKPGAIIDHRPHCGVVYKPLPCKPGLEVINLEFILRLKIKRKDWLLADMCPQAANHFALF